MLQDLIGIAAIARAAILELFHKTQLDERFPSRSPPPEVNERVRRTVASWDLGIPTEIYEPYLTCGIDIGYAAYRHTSYDVQVAISLYTFCATLYDDAIIDLDTMRKFPLSLYAGQPQPHPLLHYFMEKTLDLRQYYPPYAANAICSGTLEYANAEILAREGADDMSIRPNATQYVEYFRSKGGVAEPYAVFMWPSTVCSDPLSYVQAIPDAMNFINLLNDVFSFYKEAINGETGNYINKYAQAHAKSIEDAVQDAVHKVVQSAERVRGILCMGPARDAWEEFASGYAHFHLYCKRYRLVEVVPEYF
ncbi:terpenoid synthase [Panus rudis PR-1116 ss-1]|nr:terpenoid synthase [Panus rudis PR-1116 ss-1]